MLPMIYSLRSEGSFTEYNHESSNLAIQDFINQLPDGTNSYYKELSQFINKLYQLNCHNNEKYFLDKTPRYSLIANDLKKIFPDAKFIVLWRNPLSILSSRFHSYGNKWRIYNYKVDLFKGLNSLIDFHQQNKENICTINYENFIKQPDKELSKIFKYLDLSTNEAYDIETGSSNLTGRMGDKTGISDYKTISSDPIEKWKKTICNPLRKRWLTNYVKWIGVEKFEVLGYDYNKTLNDIKSHKVNFKNVFSDALRMTYGLIDEPLDVSVARKKYASQKQLNNLTTLR